MNTKTTNPTRIKTFHFSPLTGELQIDGVVVSVEECTEALLEADPEKIDYNRAFQALIMMQFDVQKCMDYYKKRWEE